MVFFETLLVVGIVLLAAAFFVRHSLSKTKASGCDKGCGCCTSGCETPQNRIHESKKGKNE